MGVIMVYIFFLFKIGRADAGDGGLGAGASLYLDKVAHGYACSIL